MYKRSLSIVLFVVLISCTCSGIVYAQIDLYKNLNDPRAITHFDSEDTIRMQCTNFQGITPNWDPANPEYNILAQDSGAGVLTHIWLTVTPPLSSAKVRLYIDDSLASNKRLDSAFASMSGLLHPPLSNNFPISAACDIQIPYHKNFRFEITPATWTNFYAVSWKHYNNPQSLRSAFDSSQNSSSQKFAETRFENANNPWEDSIHSKQNQSLHISPHERQALFRLSGPALIQKLQIVLNNYTAKELDSLWIKILWDDSPIAAVYSPIGLFFSTSKGSISVKSVMMQWNSQDGLVSYFPMPFSLSAEIQLENHSSVPIDVTSEITFHNEPINRERTGYFYSAFNEINPTHYNVHHRVLHTKGRGRYVGTFLNIKDYNTAGSMEGDPIFIVDSNAKYSFRYTGTEDYFNGGWYFNQVLFSTGFSGHTKRWESFYRFHILDAIDFHNSFDFDFQHGANDDVKEHYQTVAYYYKITNKFWTTTKDTLFPGQFISISGSDYQPNSEILISRDAGITACKAVSDKSGHFTCSIKTSSQWDEGEHLLAVNGETKPEPIVIVNNPTIHLIRDTLPAFLHFGDSLLVRGTGFIPGEIISFFIDDIPVTTTSSIFVDSGSSFIAQLTMPDIADHAYHIVAQGNFHSFDIAPEKITITRTLTYEFEDLLGTAHWSGDSCIRYNCSFLFWYGRWSRQEAVLYYPKHSGDDVIFKFYVPVNDTFAVTMNLTKGLSFGDFSYAIDGNEIGTFNGYYKNGDGALDPWPAKNIDLGKFAFAKDTHLIIFHCLGKDTKSSGHLLGPDVLELLPTTTRAITPGTSNDSAEVVVPSLGVSTNDFSVYPNPVTGDHLSLLLPDIRKRLQWSSITYSIEDVLGKTIFMSEPLTKIISPLNISISNIPAGSYFINCIIDINGRLTKFTFPIIVL